MKSVAKYIMLHFMDKKSHYVLFFHLKYALFYDNWNLVDKTSIKKMNESFSIAIIDIGKWNL